MLDPREVQINVSSAIKTFVTRIQIQNMKWYDKTLYPLPKYRCGMCLHAVPWWSAPAPLWSSPFQSRWWSRAVSPLSSYRCGTCRHCYTVRLARRTSEWRRFAKHQSRELWTLLAGSIYYKIWDAIDEMRYSLQYCIPDLVLRLIPGFSIFVEEWMIRS